VTEVSTPNQCLEQQQRRAIWLKNLKQSNSRREIKTLIRGALPLRRVIRMLTGDRIRILAVFSSSKVMAKWKN
jgi:hypothetical protein